MCARNDIVYHRLHYCMFLRPSFWHEKKICRNPCILSNERLFGVSSRIEPNRLRLYNKKENIVKYLGALFQIAFGYSHPPKIGWKGPPPCAFPNMLIGKPIVHHRRKPRELRDQNQCPIRFLLDVHPSAVAPKALKAGAQWIYMLGIATHWSNLLPELSSATGICVSPATGEPGHPPPILGSVERSLVMLDIWQEKCTKSRRLRSDMQGLPLKHARTSRFKTYKWMPWWT